MLEGQTENPSLNKSRFGSPAEILGFLNRAGRRMRWLTKNAFVPFGKRTGFGKAGSKSTGLCCLLRFTQRQRERLQHRPPRGFHSGFLEVVR